MIKLTVSDAAAGQRLDSWLAAELDHSRGTVQRLLKEGMIIVNGQRARASYTLRAGDVVEAESPAPVKKAPVEPPQLPVIYHDNDVVVINKPPGIAVHPGHGTIGATVADFARTVSSDPDPDRPGIVHRLDKDTSGALIIAKHPAAKVWLANQFRHRNVDKKYMALAVGKLDPDTAVIRLPLGRSPQDPLRRAAVAGGKEAETAYKTLEYLPGYSYLEAKPVTGRTHQIRAHLAAIGHPIAGDTRYGAPKGPQGLERQFLHAGELGVTLPSGEHHIFEAPLPEDLSRVLAHVRHRV